MNPISLNANLSSESIHLLPLFSDEEVGEFELKLRGQHWDGDHQHEIFLESQSILLSKQNLRVLAVDLKNWLNSEEMKDNAFAGDYSLAHETAFAEFKLIFADRDDTIAADEKPVVTTIYEIGCFAGEFSFVTDQSCLTALVRDIERYLATPSR